MRRLTTALGLISLIALTTACGGGGGGGGGSKKSTQASKFPRPTITVFGAKGLTSVASTVTLVDGPDTFADTDVLPTTFDVRLTPTNDTGGTFDEMPTLRIVGSSTENLTIGLSGD